MQRRVYHIQADVSHLSYFEGQENVSRPHTKQLMKLGNKSSHKTPVIIYLKNRVVKTFSS